MIALAVVTLLVGAGGESRAFSRAEIGLEPVRAYTDLGPVVVRQTTNAKKLRGELQVLADRIGADGFIVEERSPFVIYGQRESSVSPGPNYEATSAWADTPCPKECVNGLAFAYSAIAAIVDVVRNKKPDTRVFLRAYTFRNLPEVTRNELMSLSRKLVFGEITIAQADAQRRDLLAN